MRISLIQTNIIWENKEENLKLLKVRNAPEYDRHCRTPGNVFYGIQHEQPDFGRTGRWANHYHSKEMG